MFFALILLILSIGFKFGFDFLTSRQNITINNLERQIAMEKDAFPIANQNIVLDFQRGVRNVKQLLDSKISSSSFLANIANNTHKEIYFNYLNSNVNEKNIEIGGLAKNNAIIAQALDALKNVKGVKSVIIKSTRTAGNGISFVLALVVDQTFFR